MLTHGKSTTLTLICTRIVMAAALGISVFVPRIVDFFIYRRTVEAVGRSAVIVCVYICLVISCVILCMLDRLLGNIRKGDIFIPQNISNLSGLSWACFAMCIPCIIITFYSKIFFFLIIAAGFMGLILRVVKNVIEEAVLIKEENDYTV